MAQKIWHSIGLMSGTSLDGVDIAYVKFTDDTSLQFNILKAETIPYSAEWKNKLKNAFYSNAQEITELHTDYGRFLGNLVVAFMKENGIATVDFVASHGHTIFHNPTKGYTLQIGEGATLANTCKQTVVCDFRTQDVAFGGQGAPLVPIGDQLLFSEYDYCLNLGGFANISFEKDRNRLAQDICPVNIVLNHYSEKVGFPYDKGGNLAKSGTVEPNLLEQLHHLEFYKHKDSMGFEQVKKYVFPLIDSFTISEIDILRTYTEHAAIKMAENLHPEAKVLITGGGAYNNFLMERIQTLSKAQTVIPDAKIIDFKEAMIFALLGLLRLKGEVNCLKSVTGAVKNHSSGAVFHP